MRHEVTTHENPEVVHGVDFVYYGDQGKFERRVIFVEIQLFPTIR